MTVKNAPFCLKSADVADASELALLAERTFRETFAQDNTVENLDLYVSQAFGVERQRAELTDSRRRLTVALVDGRMVGYSHLLIDAHHPAVTEGARPVELVRLYVDLAWQGKGVAPTLMETAIEWSRNSGFTALWLGVWERNFRAQAFYAKWGFRPVGSHEFRLGTDPQRDLILARPVPI